MRYEIRCTRDVLGPLNPPRVVSRHRTEGAALKALVRARKGSGKYELVNLISGQVWDMEKGWSHGT